MQNLIDAGLLASRSVHDEIRGQTLSTLLMLPVSTGRILYGKITGSLLCWLIGPVFIMIGILALPRGFQSVHDYFSPFPRGIFFVSFLILMPHLAALTATFVRWGALPLAIALAFGTMFVSIAIFQSTGVSPENSFVTVYAMGIFGLCGACHLAVWLRINSLSAR